jgi:hypothetical protein
MRCGGRLRQYYSDYLETGAGFDIDPREIERFQVRANPAPRLAAATCRGAAGARPHRAARRARQNEWNATVGGVLKRQPASHFARSPTLPPAAAHSSGFGRSFTAEDIARRLTAEAVAAGEVAARGTPDFTRYRAALAAVLAQVAPPRPGRSHCRLLLCSVANVPRVWCKAPSMQQRSAPRRCSVLYTRHAAACSVLYTRHAAAGVPRRYRGPVAAAGARRCGRECTLVLI